jgi:putative FmdB family regulatory protein
MPIFEYQCSECDHRFEVIVLSATEPLLCPKCRSSALNKQLSVFSSRSTGAGGTPTAVAAAARRKPAAAVSFPGVDLGSGPSAGGFV